MICRRLIGVFFGVLVAFATSVNVWAQADDEWRPVPCELLGQSDTIFVGLIVGIKEDKKPPNEDQYVLIKFRVSEVFKGIKLAKTVSVRASIYSADYLETSAGKTFLVYASNADDLGILGLNTATKPLSEADRELDFLRGLNTSDPGARIFGKVSFIAKSVLKKDYEQPFTSAIVQIQPSEGEKKLRETRTDLEGRYEIEGLSPGQYRIGVVLPEGSNLYTDDNYLQVNDKGCSKANLEVKTANKVSGKVLDMDGKPVAKVPLELIPDDYEKPAFDVYNGAEVTSSNEDGSFTFSNVPPGKYNLAINYTILPEKESPYPTSYYPGTPVRGKAQIIEIGTGKEIDGIQFVLGPERLIEKKIMGRIVFPDGRPSPDTKVYLKEDENQICCVLKEATTDAKGNFVLVGFATHKYRIWTFVDHKPFTDRVNFIGVSSVFTLNGGTGPFQIVLKPTAKESLDAIDEIEMRERGKLK